MADRPVRRLWMPMTAVLLATAVVVGAWNWPNADFTVDARSMTAWAAILLAILACGAWLLFFSGLPFLKRAIFLVGGLVLLGGAAWATIDGFQGNLIPIFRWPWDRHVRGPRKPAPQVAIPSPTETDFPEYRNRKRDGVVHGLTLTRDWSANKPKELWRLSVGGGYSGISVIGPSAVTLEQIGRDEAVACYDADTGGERWVTRYSADFREPLGGDGPRTNPTIVDGDVYSLGATGELLRLDGKTGAKKWQINVLEGRHNLMWGMSGSPLVYDRFVVVNPGTNTGPKGEPASGKSVIAYDRETGKVAWASGERQGSYCSPQLVNIAGVPQVLIFDAVGLVSYDAKTGKELWAFDYKTNYDVNAVQPLVFDDGRVYLVAGYGHGGAMIKVTLAEGKWSVQELWTDSKLKCKFSNPVHHDGFIYGIDEARGALTCLDANTGKMKWKDGEFGNGQLLLVGDLLLIQSELGKLVLAEANPDKYHEIGFVQALPGRKNWNYITVACGRAYMRNHEFMACFELPVKAK